MALDVKKRILVIISIIITLLTVLSACNKIPAPPVEAELDAILNSETNLSLVSKSGQFIESLAGGDTSSKILESISYTIISTEIEKTTATSVVRFETPDIVSMATQFAQVQHEVGMDFNSWLKNELNRTYPTIKEEVILELVYLDNAWSLVATEDLYNILTGGALNYYIEQQQSAYNGWRGTMENEKDD